MGTKSLMSWMRPELICFFSSSLIFAMGFFRDEDTTGDEHNQSPELMIPQGKMKRAVDELIEHKSGASAGQGEADDSIVISFPDHLSPSPLRQS